MMKPEPATEEKPTQSALEEANEVKSLVMASLARCSHAETPKFVDAYSRAANVVRQLEKDRRKELALVLR